MAGGRRVSHRRPGRRAAELSAQRPGRRRGGRHRRGGSARAYTLETTLVVGYLENPGSASFQSGIGVISGWVCDAELVEIELNGVPQEAAYGTERLDTEAVCGDTDNGFGLLFNWNRLEDGAHEVVAFVDGVELGRATVHRHHARARSSCRGRGRRRVRWRTSPRPGETVPLAWQESLVRTS